MPERLTDKAIWKLPAPERGNKVYRDAANASGKDWTAGFGLRVTAAGARSFVFEYRTKSGAKRRLTIGSPPAWGLAAARKEATELSRQIDLGGDPLTELRNARGEPTVAELCDRLIADHLPKKRASTRTAYEGIINNHIKPALGTRKVAEIAYTDIDRLHQRVTSRVGPYAGNRTLAVLSKAFNLAIRLHMRTTNPVKGVERNLEERRERYLSAQELQRLSAALASYEDQVAANAIRLLLLTGARKNEVLTARWEDFDLEEGVWTKPGAATKQTKPHRVPLSAPALQILVTAADRTERGAPWVFPGRILGQHRVNIKDDWATVCKAAGISAARIHDLRHTYASLLASAGQSLPVIGALLGHTQPATTARYAHLLDDPLRKATDRVGAMLSPKVGTGGKVVSLGAKRERQ
jgi:integrase